MTLVVAFTMFLFFAFITVLASWAAQTCWDYSVGSDGFTGAVFFTGFLITGFSAGASLILTFVIPIVALVVGA